MVPQRKGRCGRRPANAAVTAAASATVAANSPPSGTIIQENGNNSNDGQSINSTNNFTATSQATSVVVGPMGHGSVSSNIGDNYQRVIIKNEPKCHQDEKSC